MSKKVIAIVLLFVVSFSGLKAQQLRTSAYPLRHSKEKKPVPYQYVREADVMWSKTIWRILELREKINHPLYYPEEVMGDRMSLISVLLKGVRSQGIDAYDEDSQTGDEFATVLTQEKVQENMGGKFVAQEQYDLETGARLQDTMVWQETQPKEVKQFLMKEVWFFDKQRSVMEVRIIGLCPIRWYREDPNNDDSKLVPKKLFWVHYPEVRKILANHFVFNPKNDIRTLSFDELFLSRRFSSHIVQESNTYNNRAISQYSLGLESLLESERINDNIFNYEQDLWHY